VSAPEEEIDDGQPEATTADVVEQGRRRPPDLVGTRPEWDPEALTPTETPRAAAGRLWADADADADADATVSPAPVAAQAPAAVAAEGDDDPPVYSRYSARFQFLLGALLAIGLSAVALLAAVLVGNNSDNSSIGLRDAPAWSSWHPAATPGSIDAADEIAEHVGHEYRRADKQQLVSVEASSLQFGGLPVTIIIDESAARGGAIDLLNDSVGVMYRMCGVEGQGHCQVPGGMTPANTMLLRREALELALYSFRYLGVSETVVLLPPASVKENVPLTALHPTTSDPVATTVPAPSTALLFRSSQPDVQAALLRPLSKTLSAEKTPTVEDVARSKDAAAVTRLTKAKAYSSRFSPTNEDAGLYLVLSPLAR
jgi:hypothetical protein